jgi:hypothetical protein
MILAGGDALGLLAAQERATIDPGRQDTFAAMRLQRSIASSRS